mmetsp:Transcript_27903/g.66287  ORF Transcript_27903/g.66287 Transcript_27903/m.66287 type:complete len:283 (-) Transcript_27903:25-873(-)
MSPPQVGSDLSHVFCERAAAPVIKCYSPELIVHPYLHDSRSIQGEGPSRPPEDFEATVTSCVDRVAAWLPKMSCVVIGPGLGRDAALAEAAGRILAACREAGVPVVIDADGLALVNASPQIVRGYKQAVLTPNVVEFQRLAAALGVDADSAGPDSVDPAVQVAQRLDGPTLLRKGGTDTITDGNTVVLCDDLGSMRRCGGQGDVLSGTLAAFLSWARTAPTQELQDKGPVLAAAGACLVTRHAAAAAFSKHKRAMRAGCLIDELGPVMDSLFDNPRPQTLGM